MAKTKTIITCAVTGSIHTPTMSDHLPITQNDIASPAAPRQKTFISETSAHIAG